MHISKSDYLLFKQCPKSYWLRQNLDKLQIPSSLLDSKVDKGNQVTEAARELFPGGTLIAYQHRKKMIEETKQLIKNGGEVIYEATFEWNGLYVRCDLLARDEDGWNMFEVKSSTSLKKRHYDDLSFQAMVLENSEIAVKNYYLVHINKEYEREEELDVHALFKVENKTADALSGMDIVGNDVMEMKKVIGMADYDCEIGSHCEKYGEDDFPCIFKEYCWGHIPNDSVFGITKIGKKKFDLYHDGIIRIEDIPDDYKLSKDQQLQVMVQKKNERIFNKELISNYLSQFIYPLYFLDFETYQQAVPLFEGIKPYEQIPFQYSLHIMEDKHAKIKHKEFLAKEGEDPRRAFAERLIADIPLDVCSVAYNISFEKQVIKNMAHLFPDLADHLMNIHDHMIDLMVPFQKKWLYTKEMQGKYSIKNVLPALFPGADELDYQSLTIQNGAMAMSAFETLHLCAEEDIEQVRLDLLEYCRLDTLAMVKIYEKLVKLTAE